jgi:hypothetical protein
MKMKLFYLLVCFGLVVLLGADGIEPLGNPREISTLDHLLWISTNSSSWGDDFIQIADIDASSTIAWNGGLGFYPIGSNDTSSFVGSYNGNGFSINGLFINRSGKIYVGLFGYIRNATLENIRMQNSDIYGLHHVGNIVGYSELSSIENCSVSGLIRGSDYVGGIVGGTHNSTFINNFSSGEIIGRYFVGGLIAYNYGLSVTNCVSTANVRGAQNAAGLIGYIYNSNVSNCYSRGNVTRTFLTIEVGGFVGTNAQGHIANSFSTGWVKHIDGTYVARGFAGYIIAGTFSNCFWDIETSGTSTSAGSGTGLIEGKSTAQMKTQTTFSSAGWNLTDVWQMNPNYNDGYPYLSWQIFEDDAPLPVVLSSFAAIQTTNNFAQINWTTQSETNLLGYNLYRNTENTNSGSQKINPQMIYGENSSIGSNYSYTDETVEYEQPYYYWLESVELSGNTELFGPVSMTLENPENNAPELPNMTILKQNYPNPFNPSTTIEFSIKENETGKLSIFNVKGQLIENKEFQTGVHSYHWNAEKFSSGIYFYRLQTQSVNQIKKMMMMK